MALTSSGKTSSKGRGRKSEPVIKLSDVTCPICYEICIEPVTMPCKHELCLSCFEQHVQEASLRCPVCRCYISNWARKAHRQGTLVNQKRWSTIQQYFPERVHRRLAGEEGESDSDDVGSIKSRPCISEQGEIRREYEVELRKLRDDEEKQRELENAKSEKLIKMLTKMDERDAEKKRIELLRLTKDDSIIARALSDDINDNPTAEDLYVVDSEFLDERATPRANSLPSLDAPSKSRKRGRPFLSTGFAAPPGSSHTTRAASQSVHHSDPEALRASATPVQCTMRSSSSASLPLCLEKFSVDDTHDAEDVVMLCNPDTAGPSRLSDGSTTTGKNVKLSLDRHVFKHLSAESEEDSISGELCHFRPIKVAPKTPPGRSPDGSLFEPAPVYTPRPRNSSNERTARHNPPPISDMQAWLIGPVTSTAANLVSYSCSKPASFPLTPTNVSPKRLLNRNSRSVAFGMTDVENKVKEGETETSVVVDGANKENPVVKAAAFAKPVQQKTVTKQKSRKSYSRPAKVQRVHKQVPVAPPTPPITRRRTNQKATGTIRTVAPANRSVIVPESGQGPSRLPSSIGKIRTTRSVGASAAAGASMPIDHQEEMDYQLALKVEREWQRQITSVDRRAGTDGQYLFRRRTVK